MFTAVVPPDDVLECMEAFLAPRRDADRLRWTSHESWHLTLGFMAEVPDRSLEDLVERLRRAGRRRTPFSLAIAGGGTFPNPARAKVLYAAVAAGPAALEELRRLSVGARAAANKAGAPCGGAAFRPHVTLARMNRPMEASRWLRVMSAYRSRDFEVTDFALVQSFLGQGPRGRPRYQTVERFGLGRG